MAEKDFMDGTLHAAMIAALMPVSWAVGRQFQRRGLPAITGYMCAGLACGPHMLNLAQPEEVAWMWLVESWCLALIALAAGSELHLSELSEQRRPVAFVATAISLTTWLLVFGGFVLCSSVLPLTRLLTLRRTYAMASLTATLMIARSPASCLAILREVDAQGPFSNLVLAVTVISDVLVLVLFSVNLELVVVMYEVVPVGCADDGCMKELDGGGLIALMARPVLMLAGAAVLGLSGGWMLLQLTRLRSALPHRPQLMMVLIACATQALSLLAEHFGIEGLLVCLVAGGFAANRAPPTWPASPREAVDDRSQRARQALHITLEALLPSCCVVFFTLVGTTLKLSVLMTTAPTACLLAGLRLLAIAIGAAKRPVVCCATFL
jgi:Kef-type K+ transport system membrane component KefB